MATRSAAPGVAIDLIASAGTGNFTSDTADRGSLSGPVGLLVDTTAGTTLTLTIQGSIDGTTFFPVEYALVATPSTKVVSTIAITTTTVNQYLITGSYGWRFLNCAISANTGMTVNRLLCVFR
jgi:hypothetical protein